MDSPYGLSKPTTADARDAVHRVHGDDGTAVWAQLLSTTGLSGQENDEDSFDRLLQALDSADPVSRLCAEALRIRRDSYTFLAAAHTLTRSTA